MKEIIAAIGAIVWTYCAGAFISLEANPLDWPEMGRAGFVLITSSVVVIAAVHSLD